MFKKKKGPQKGAIFFILGDPKGASKPRALGLKDLGKFPPLLFLALVLKKLIKIRFLAGAGPIIIIPCIPEG